MEEREIQAQVLGDILAEHERILNEALAIWQREEPIVTGLRRTIAALMGRPETSEPMQYNAFGKGSTIIWDAGSNIITSDVVGPPSPLDDELKPRRKPEYAQLTIVASVVKALEKLAPAGSHRHVDELVKEIYEPISHRDVFYRIKRTLVSEIIRGMRKGLFIRGPKPNTFASRIPIANGRQPNLGTD